MSRRRSMMAVVAVFCLCLCWLAVGPTAVAAQGPTAVSVTDLTGNGTASDPYVVTNVSGLQAMNQSLEANYTLGGDIDASETTNWFDGAGFVPIGNATSPFTGTFDGDGHVIDGLFINRSTTDDVGLFGRLGSGGTVTTVGLEAVNITGAERVGGLIGSNNATDVHTVYATGRIEGGRSTGGLVGLNDNDGVVRTSYATGTVTGDYFTGGLVGLNDYGASVESSYAAANVTGNNGVGGVLGLENSGATGSYGNINTTEQSSYTVTGLETQQMQGNWSVGNMSAFDFESTWTAVAGDYPDLQAMPRQTSTPNSKAPTITEQARIFSELEYYNGAYNVTSDKALQTINLQTNSYQLDGVYSTLSANYRLVVDIDASGTTGWSGGEGFVPIGNSTSPFTGSLNGGGHAIQDLSISIPQSSSGTDGGDAAIFNRTEAASFSNIHLVDVSITGGDGGPSMSIAGGDGGGAGGLIAALNNGSVTDVVLTDSTITSGSGADGYGGGGSGGPAGGLVASANNGTIENLTVINSTTTGGDGGIDTTTGTFPGDGGHSGGIVGTITTGTVSDSVVEESAIVSGDGATGSEGDGDSGYVGGIAGVNTDGTVTTSSVDAYSTVTGGNGGLYAAAGAGGLVGSNGAGTISRSHSAARVSSVVRNVGGVVGTLSSGTVRNSLSTGNVTGTRNVGGIIGSNQGGTVSGTDAQGRVNGTESVGGLVGQHRASATLDNSSSRADVNGTNGVGGLVGASNAAQVTDSFAAGAVNGMTAVGGLVGSLDSDSQVYSSHWNTETTGQTNSTGVLSGVRVGLSGLSTSQMTGTAVRTNMALFDYTSTWTVTDSYPRLQWAIENVSLTVADSTITDEGATSAVVTLSLVDGSTVSATTTATLTSTDTEVLSLSGSTVSAAGTGTAQVSTTVAGLTDSVTVTVEASEEDDSEDGSGSSNDNDGDDNDDDDNDTTTTVTAVDTSDEETTGTSETNTDDDETTGDAGTDSTVRVSSASASVRGGSTLQITLPPVADQEPTNETTGDSNESTDETTGDGNESTDEPITNATDGAINDTTTKPDGTATDPDGTGGELGATDPNRPPPPPVSQAEIESVEIDVSEDVDAEVEIRQSRGPPTPEAAEFRRDDGTQAAGYIEVTDNLDDDQVTEGRISFRLSKADLATDAADPENIALYHYIPETGEWEELDTEIVGETDSYVRFRGTTPGFSQFATGIKRAQFEINDALVDVQELTLGDSIQVEAIVTNTGGADGTFTTQLLVDSEVVAEDVLTIASGGTRATIFDHEFTVADTYEVRVNDVSTGEITVTDPNATSAGSTDGFLPGFGAGTALLALVVTTLLYRRTAS